MLKLSDSATRIVRELGALDRQWHWFGLRGRRERALCERLQALGAMGEPAALLGILDFLTSPSPVVRDSARDAARQLLANVTPDELPRYEDQIRLWWSGPFGSKWEAIEASQVGWVAGSADESGHAAALGLLSFHRNGFVRHEAVRRLATLSNGAELPFLLLRLNDWVEPIAAAAHAAVAPRISTDYLPHIERWLRLLMLLCGCRRRDLGAILTRLTDLLLMAEHAALFQSVVDSSDRDVRRYFVKRGLETAGGHRRRILLAGVNSPDPIVRLHCCRHATNCLEDRELTRVLGRLLADPAAAVRREALRAEAERSSARALVVWRKALLDTNRSIRAIARHRLGTLGESDAASVYRAALGLAPDSLPALEGLAEVGGPADAPLFRAYLRHRWPSRRGAAASGLARVARATALRDLMPLLTDSSLRVVRQAERGLRPYVHLLTGEELLSIALGSDSSRSRASAVGLLAAFGKWRAIPWLVRAASGAPADTSSIAKQSIVRWLTPPMANRVMVAPTDQEVASIRESLSEASGRLSSAIAECIQLALDSVG